MELRTLILGASDLAITRIGLGTWAIGGGDWVFGWGPQGDAQSIATIRRAIERGVNWIDTAGVYGLGRAETVIARALRAVPFDERPYIFGTCSLVWDDLGNVSHNLSASSIRRELEGSLRRLSADRIDLYQIGWPINPCPSVATSGSLEEAWETLASLQEEDKVRHIGVCHCHADQLLRLQRIAPVTSLQARCSLADCELDQAALAYCEHHAVGVLASSPIGSGLLTGTMTHERVSTLPHNDWRRCNPAFQQPALDRASAIVEELRTIGDRLSLSPAAVAVAWTLRRPAVTAAVVGARRPQQLDDVLQAETRPINPTEFAQLDLLAAALAEETVGCRRR